MTIKTVFNYKYIQIYIHQYFDHARHIQINKIKAINSPATPTDLYGMFHTDLVHLD